MKTARGEIANSLIQQQHRVRQIDRSDGGKAGVGKESNKTRRPEARFDLGRTEWAPSGQALEPEVGP